MNKKENPWLNLIVNIAIPAVVMMKFSSDDWLGPLFGLLVALAFPIGYGVYDFVLRRKYNLFSILGFVSVLLTGGIGVLELDPKWLAIKEAAVPLIIGMVIVISVHTKWPIIEKILQEVLLMETIKPALQQHGAGGRSALTEYNRRVIQATYIIGASFLLSSGLNFILARVIVTADPGTELFTSQLGKLTALSYPVIALPSTIVMVIGIVFLIHHITKLTGLEIEQVMRHVKPTPKTASKKNSPS